jgi:hypothetical protein
MIRGSVRAAAGCCDGVEGFVDVEEAEVGGVGSEEGGEAAGEEEKRAEQGWIEQWCEVESVARSRAWRRKSNMSFESRGRVRRMKEWGTAKDAHNRNLLDAHRIPDILLVRKDE